MNSNKRKMYANSQQKLTTSGVMMSGSFEGLPFYYRGSIPVFHEILRIHSKCRFRVENQKSVYQLSASIYPHRLHYLIFA